MHTDYLKYCLGDIFKQCFTTSHNSTTWKESWKPCLFFFFFFFFKFFLWEKLILLLKTAKPKDSFIKSLIKACISSLLSILTHHLQNVHSEREYVQPDFESLLVCTNSHYRSRRWVTRAFASSIASLAVEFFFCTIIYSFHHCEWITLKDDAPASKTQHPWQIGLHASLPKPWLVMCSLSHDRAAITIPFCHKQ